MGTTVDPCRRWLGDDEVLDESRAPLVGHCDVYDKMVVLAVRQPGMAYELETRCIVAAKEMCPSASRNKALDARGQAVREVNFLYIVFVEC